MALYYFVPKTDGVRPLVRLNVTVIAEQTVAGEVRREVGSGGGVHRGAVHQFQRGELLGLSGSAAGVCAVFGCLHRFALSTQHHGPGMVHTFFGASLALKTSKSRCNPHEC